MCCDVYVMSGGRRRIVIIRIWLERSSLHSTDPGALHVVCATTAPFKLNVRMTGEAHDRWRRGGGAKIWREGDEAAVVSRRFFLTFVRTVFFDIFCFVDPTLGSKGMGLKLKELRRQIPNLHYMDQFMNPANPSAYFK